MKRSVQSASPVVAVGSKGWRDATVHSILRAAELTRQTRVDQLHSSTRYRSHNVGTFAHRRPQLTASSDEKDHRESDSEKKDEFRLKSTGRMLTSRITRGPFPPPALRDQSALVSTGMVGEYTRGVREVEGHLRRQAGRVTQEGTRVEHLREQLEKLLRSLRKALLVNQQSADGRTFRPPTTETIRDGADDLLHNERKVLNVLKEELDSMLRKTLTQQKALAESSKQLLDCAFERSRVIDLLPQHGSLSAGVKTYPSPLSQKPDPTGPFTPECKQALDSASTVLRESQQLRKNISQVMRDVIKKQTDMHQSASQALQKKITETISLEQHLTLSSAATRQAIYRKQRQMQCAGYSLGRAMGTTMLRKHLESSGKEIAELQFAHQQLEDDMYGKRAAGSVDSAIVRLRRRLQHLTLSSAATRQAIYRKQRQMQCAGYSLGRAMGPVCSADLFCRERLSRPMTQLYGRHSSVGLPESDLLTWILRKHLESSGKEIAELQFAHQQLEDDMYGKRAAGSVDSAIVRLRRRLVRPQSVRPVTS